MKNVRLKLVAFDVGHTLIDESIDAATFVLPVRLMPHVEEILPQIPMPMAVWSNTRSAREAEVRKLLAAGGIEQFFTSIVTSVDAGYRKPDPGFFHFAVNKCAISVDEVLFVGNQLNTDVCGGVQSGIATVWVAGEAHRSFDDGPSPARPDFTIDSLLELPTLIRGLQT
ncbi:MAG TPA: HAD family hydrolase [Terriglobales bacterium]|nr:HAD family hydrolase [Terriglobales bacterium]